MEDLMQRVKSWYSGIKERIRDGNTIRRYECLENKMRRLEEMNRGADYISNSGYLTIFTEEYSKLMDEEDKLQPLAISAMRRQSERISKRYSEKTAAA